MGYTGMHLWGEVIGLEPRQSPSLCFQTPKPCPSQRSHQELWAAGSLLPPALLRGKTGGLWEAWKQTPSWSAVGDASRPALPVQGQEIALRKERGKKTSK